MMLGKGQAILNAGRVTVPHRRLPADAWIVLERVTVVGTAGEMMQPTVQEKVGFTITSTNPLDNSVVSWMAFV